MTYTLTQGTNGYWFIREDGKFIAGFVEKELAERVLEMLVNNLV